MSLSTILQLLALVAAVAGVAALSYAVAGPIAALGAGLIGAGIALWLVGAVLHDRGN